MLIKIFLSDEIMLSNYYTLQLFFLLAITSLITGFKTGLEEGLICNVCVGTHPGIVLLSHLEIVNDTTKEILC